MAIQPLSALGEFPVLLDTQATATLLCCSPKTLEADRVRKRWRVPFLRIGRAIRYDQQAVIKWLADRNPSDSKGC